MGGGYFWGGVPRGVLTLPRGHGAPVLLLAEGGPGHPGVADGGEGQAEAERARLRLSLIHI